MLPYTEFIKQHTGVSHRRFPIRDVSTPRSQAVTSAILDVMDAEISRGGGVYVHCWGGVGRTGLVVGCWLARNCSDGKSALLQLRQLWQRCPKSLTRQSPETIEQVRYIVNWKEAR
jgi:protein-tyrosine phosphatase